MQQGEIVFTHMNRVIFGHAAAEAVAGEAARLGAERIFLLVGGTLNRETDEVDKLKDVLGERFAGLCDHMPSHSPRDAVVDCANAAREAGTDLLVTFGGGSVTDGGKAVTLCLEHGVTDMDGLEPLRTWLDDDGVRQFPDIGTPKVRQVVVPTTLSGGEFNARAGVTDPRVKLKQSYIGPGIIPESVILDPAVTVHTPEWLWLSTGIRAVDHAVESYLSVDANDYTDGTALQALRLLGEGLRRCKDDPADLEARGKCLMGAWLSMAGVVTGTSMGASHAIGHILGGSAGVPHGYTSCIMLPYVLAWNQGVNGHRQADVAGAFGRSSDAASEVLNDFIAGLGMPRRLSDVGIKPEQLPQLAKNCMLDSWTFTNPRKIDNPEQVLEILETAMWARVL